MKRLLVLVGCAVFLSGLVGCQGFGRNKSGVDVVIEGDGEFPASLAGRWRDERKGWEFVFEPDGTISSAVIDNGLVPVIPSEGVATLPTRMGGKAVYKLGEWMVQYSPGGRELTVQVVVEHFHIDMGPNALEGHRTDWFTGTVSEDFQKWEVIWSSIPKYIAFTPEPAELPVDPNELITELLFEKVAEQTN